MRLRLPSRPSSGSDRLLSRPAQSTGHAWDPGLLSLFSRRSSFPRLQPGLPFSPSGRSSFSVRTGRPALQPCAAVWPFSFAVSLSDSWFPPDRLAPAAAAGRPLPVSGAGVSVSKKYSSRSSGQVAGAAPCRIRRLQPSLRLSLTRPGRAKTSRPCSSAISTVIRVPDFLRASMTRTASASPLMILLRSGNRRASGGVPGGYSERIPPCCSSLS